MKYLAPVVAAILVAGCAGLSAPVPQPVLDAGVKQMQTLQYLEEKTLASIDVLADDNEELLTEGFEMALSAEEQKMVDSEGRVYLTEYKNYLLDLGDTLTQRKAVYRNKAEFAKMKLQTQFTNAKLLASGIQAYNEASGITDETWNALISGGGELADVAISAYTQYKTLDDMKEEADRQRKEARRGSVLQFVEQLNVAKERKQPANPSWLLDAFEAIRAGTDVPPLPEPEIVEPDVTE